MRSSSALAYMPALDGVRGLAIALVTGYHLAIGDRHALAGGFIGVDLFFVLSGALITELLLRELDVRGRLRLGAFYARRAARLLPALFAMLAITAAVVAVSWPADRAREVHLDAIRAAFYLASGASVDRPQRLLSATWSLSVEEWFYVIWPLLLLVLVRSSRRALLLGILAIVIAVPVWRLALVESYAPLRRLYFCLDTRADALAMGCLCAALVHRGLGVRAQIAVRITAPLALLALLAASPFADWLSRDFALFGYSAVAIACALVVALARTAPWPFLAWPPLVWLGRLSYGIYLWENPVFAALSRSAPWLRVAAVVAVAAASYAVIERPAMRWIRARLALAAPERA